MSLMASGMSGKGQLAPASHPVDLDHSGYTAADVANTSGQSCHAEDGTKGRHGDLLQELQSTRLLLLQTQCIVDSKDRELSIMRNVMGQGEDFESLAKENEALKQALKSAHSSARSTAMGSQHAGTIQAATSIVGDASDASAVKHAGALNGSSVLDDTASADIKGTSKAAASPAPTHITATASAHARSLGAPVALTSATSIPLPADLVDHHVTMAAPAATPTAAADADSKMSAAATMAVLSSQSANGSSSSVTSDVTARAVHAVPQLDADAFMSRMRALVSGLLQEQLQERARQRLQQQSQHSQQPGTALANNAAAAGANEVFQSSSMQHPVHRAQGPAPEGNPLAEYGGITSHAGAGMLHTYPARTGQASASAPGPSTLSYLPAVAATGLPTASAAKAAPPGGVRGQGPHAVVGQPYGQQHGGSSTNRHAPAAHAAASAAAAHVSAGMQSLTIPVALPQSWSGPSGQEPLVIQINLILQPPAAAAASQQLPTELSLPLPPVAYMLPKQQPGVDMLQQQLLQQQQWTQPMLHCPDVLQLNVGGVPMAVTRSALEHARGSHLYSSLVIEYGLQPRDADGRIMLPYPAAAFHLLLGYLQQRANSTAAAHAQGISLASPAIGSEQAASWRQSAERTGISAAALAQVASDLGLSDIATSLARHAAQTPRSSRLWSPESSSPPLLAAAAQGSTLRRASSPYEEGEQAGSALLTLPSTVLPGVDPSGTALPPGSLQDLMQQGREGHTDSAVASALFADTLRNQHACSPGRVAQGMHARTEPWGMEALQEWANPGAPKVAGHLAGTSSGGVPSGESPDPWVPSPDVPAMAQSASSSTGMASAAAHPQQAVPRAALTAAEMLNRDDLIALLIEQAGLLGIAVPSSVSPDRVAPAAVTGASSATAGTAMGSMRSSTADTPSPLAKGLEVSYGALSLPTYTPSSAHQPVAADVIAYGSGAGTSPSMTHSPQALAAAAAAVRHGVGHGYLSGGSQRSAMAVPPGVAVVPNMYELLAQKRREQAD